MHTEIQEPHVSQTNSVAASLPTGGNPLPFKALAKIKNIQAENIFIKASCVPKNIKFYNKRTPDEHVVILAQGEVVGFDENMVATRYVAPASGVIPANTRMVWYTVEDSVFYCVHATSETDPDVLDKKY